MDLNFVATVAMLFEELVKQHRVHFIVAHSERLALFVGHDEIGDLPSLTSSATSPNCSAPFGSSSFLVAEDDRLEIENPFTGLIHRPDRFLT